MQSPGIFRRTGRRTLGVAAALALGLATLVALPSPASAAAYKTVNLGFEDGVVGWANGEVTQEYAGHTAPAGDWFAVAAAVYTASGGGCYPNVIRRGLTNVQAGDTISGWAFFMTEGSPGDSRAYVEFMPNRGTAGFPARVNAFEVDSSDLGGSTGSTGWQPWTYTFPATGSYTFSAWVRTGGLDCAPHAVIGLDLAEGGDDVPPVISASATSDDAPYTAGAWTNDDVTVHFDCADADSGVATLTGDTTLGTEGADQSATGTCTDNAGNTAEATFDGINIDTTAPEVTFSGNAGSYGSSDQVEIGCEATDVLSGVAWSTCEPVSGPAYSFALGTNTLSATATDNAGNTGTGSTSFEVVVGYDDLAALTAQFSTKAGIANSLGAKLDAAKKSADRGQDKAAQNQLNAYVHQVSAQSGKAFTASQADILIALVAAL